jgi:glutamyl-tRNA reductase
MDKNEKERLTKAEQTAGLLASDLKEILTRTDNLALEEIMVESMQQVEKIRQRLKRFAGN